jgi:hypothetical protein
MDCIMTLTTKEHEISNHVGTSDATRDDMMYVSIFSDRGSTVGTLSSVTLNDGFA